VITTRIQVYAHHISARLQGRHSNLGDRKPEANNNLRAVLLDTRGPEIRSGKLQNDDSGHETVSLVAGETITLHTAPLENGSTETDLFIDYSHLHFSLKPGMQVLLDDGAISLTVTKVHADKGQVECVIENSGDLRSRAGVNLPGAETDLPAMSEKDKVDIKYGMTKDIDYVAASFIQNAAGVEEIRKYIQETAQELGWEESAPLPLIISKIESMAALRNFDEILEKSDGIMVARGDLGVELPIQQVTNAQKEMVAACNAVGKPVIVATQCLESMTKNPRPTRAEVADVTNAVYDGADCLMLSGETAKGKYPVEAVRMMSEIIYSAEMYMQSGGYGSLHAQTSASYQAPDNSLGAIAKAAVAAAEERGAAAILVLTQHGTLPKYVSGFRPNCPIVVFCPSAKIGRQLMFYRGVHPVVGLEGVSLAKRPEIAVKNAKAMGFIQSGEDVVVVTMEDYYEGLERTATMKIATVP
jgi:pyruvate kinase